jgi:hypothetical protein
MANAPVFLNMSIRPVKVVVAEPAPSVSLATRAAMYVPIWKCGTSTVDEVVLATLYNCSSPPRSRCLGPHAHYYDGRHGQSEAQRAASAIFLPQPGARTRAPIATFYMGPSTASPDYDRVRRQPGSTLFTIVRDPLTRFVSGWLPRTTMPLCENSTQGVRVATWLGQSKTNDLRRLNLSDLVGRGALFACPQIVRAIEAHAHNISADAASFPFQRIGWIHWLSQAYFLAATDAAGQPLPFEHVVRLERFEDDFQGVLAAFGIQGGLPSAVADRRHNSNHLGTVDIYAAALRSKPQTICVLCAILAIDYDCLGYEPPPECRQCEHMAKHPRLAADEWTRGQHHTRAHARHGTAPQTRCPRAPETCEFVPEAEAQG